MKPTPQPIQHGSAHPLSPDLSIGNPNNVFAQVAEIFKMYLLLLRDRCGRLDLITTGLRRRCVPSIHSGFQIGLQKWKLRVEDLRFVLLYKLLTKILQYVLLRIPDRSQNVGLHPGGYPLSLGQYEPIFSDSSILKMFNCVTPNFPVSSRRVLWCDTTRQLNKSSCTRYFENIAR